VIPAAFDYRAPTSLAAAAELLAATPGAKLLNGGMSLIPAMKQRLAAPPLLVDLGRVPGLRGVEVTPGGVRIGARATHSDVGREFALATFPLFAEVALQIGDCQVQNRGTLAGSLVHADPAADWPAVFLALEGEAVVWRASGQRILRATDFFTDLMTSALDSEEIVTAVSFSLDRERSGSAYLKVRQLASGFALVGVAARVGLDGRGRCDRVAIGVTGVNAVPFRARSVEERLRGGAFDVQGLREACAEVDEAEPLADPEASAEYRRHLLSVYTARAVGRAYERARAPAARDG